MRNCERLFICEKWIRMWNLNNCNITKHFSRTLYLTCSSNINGHIGLKGYGLWVRGYRPSISYKTTGMRHEVWKANVKLKDIILRQQKFGKYLSASNLPKYTHTHTNAHAALWKMVKKHKREARDTNPYTNSADPFNLVSHHFHFHRRFKTDNDWRHDTFDSYTREIWFKPKTVYLSFTWFKNKNWKKWPSLCAPVTYVHI